MKYFNLISLLSIVVLFACQKDKDINELNIESKYPVSKYLSKIGNWPSLVKSGGGYFYDEVLEYRVWSHPEKGAIDIDNGDDYYHAFPSYELALSFSNKTKGAEEPLVLVRQWEHVNEPAPGVFEHIKGERITEWQVCWLEGANRKNGDIERFIKEKSLK
jgi:hypothetical protein